MILRLRQRDGFGIVEAVMERKDFALGLRLTLLPLLGGGARKAWRAE